MKLSPRVCRFLALYAALFAAIYMAKVVNPSTGGRWILPRADAFKR